jgi:hypothetical protein
MRFEPSQFRSLALSNVIEFPRPKVELPIKTRDDFWALKRNGAKITQEHASRLETLLDEVRKTQTAAPAR